MSVDGYRCDRPNPATPMLARSPISATASAAVITFPLAGAFITTEFPSCLRADLPWLSRGDFGVLVDPVGDGPPARHLPKFHEIGRRYSRTGNDGGSLTTP